MGWLKLINEIVWLEMKRMCWICCYFGIRDIVKRGEIKFLVKIYLDVKILIIDKIF